MMLRSPSSAPRSLVARPTTVDMFAYRAAAAADLADVETLDVGIEAGGYRRFFQSERYRTIAVPEPRSDRRSHYPGFVPRQPIDVLPVASSSVGLVFCPGVVERSPDPQGFMVELTRTLQPEGRLFLTSPLIVSDDPGHQPGRNRFGLGYLVDAAGLTIEDLTPLRRSTAYAMIARK